MYIYQLEERTVGLHTRETILKVNAARSNKEERARRRKKTKKNKQRKTKWGYLSAKHMVGIPVWHGLDACRHQGAQQRDDVVSREDILQIRRKREGEWVK